MASPVQPPFLEVQKQLWKVRAQAKQQWLEQSLAPAARTPDDAEWRLTWIRQALSMVKRGQAEIKYHAALLDVYREHLGVLEVTLIAAAEQKGSGEEAANLSVEAAMASGARPADSLKRKHV